MVRRWSRVLLAGLFLPLALVVGSQGVAAAVELEWERVAWRLDIGGAPDVDCVTHMSYDTRYGIMRNTGGECIGGYDSTPGFSQAGEADSTYWFYVTGLGCADEAQQKNSTKSLLGSHSRNGTSNVAGSFGETVWAVNTACKPDQACVALEESTWGTTYAFRACSDVEFDEVAREDGTCTSGMPIDALWAYKKIESGTYQGYFRDSGEAWISGSTGAVWYMKPVWIANTGGPPTAWSSQYSAVPNAEGKIGPFLGSPNATNKNQTAVLMGVQLTRVNHTDNEFGSNVAGYTKPSQCIFYFGTKFRTTSADDTDEPWGPNGEETVPPPTTSPVVDDGPKNPPTDDVGWLGLIWQLLKQIASGVWSIVTAIGSLAAAIVGGILDGLAGLFVPSDGFFEAKMHTLKNSAQGTTVGNYSDAVQDALVVPSASGCQGPAVNMGGGSETSHPLSACGEPLSTLAALSRLILTASVGIAGALACMRILGKAIGWEPVSTS